jgi:peptide/nickel transport system substrate-binding protein
MTGTKPHQLDTRAIHAEQQFVIGIVAGVPQPVVARDTLVNLPKEGFYNWDPGAFFGIYRPDTFFFKN